MRWNSSGLPALDRQDQGHALTPAERMAAEGLISLAERAFQQRS
jgi:hypothetical protein